MPSGADYQNNPRVEGGQVEEIVVPNPAAGAAWTTTIPAGYTWEVRGIACKLVTDANVASRTNFIITVTDGTTELGRTFAQTTCAASKTFRITSAIGYQGGGAGINDVGTVMSIPMGDGTRMLPGWVITLSLTAEQAGDQFSDIILTVIRRPFPN
jgi:hypothetical protein